jgi:hypothetical protein
LRRRRDKADVENATPVEPMTDLEARAARALGRFMHHVPPCFARPDTEPGAHEKCDPARTKAAGDHSADAIV